MRPSLPELPYTAQRGERLSNWLALLALLAAGIVWTPADAAAPLEKHAGSVRLKACADATPVEALRQATRMPAVVSGNVMRVEGVGAIATR
jgi:hypothetical protein